MSNEDLRKLFHKITGLTWDISKLEGDRKEKLLSWLIPDGKMLDNPDSIKAQETKQLMEELGLDTSEKFSDNESEKEETSETYTAAEAAEYNLTLDGALQYGAVKTEHPEEESNSYDYIYDESSWNDSFTNGALKKYYAQYPDEDRYNQNEHRWAWETDKVDGEWPSYCVQCWEGAVNANAAIYPWICPNFDIDVNATIKFQYEGKDDVTPWGNKVFGIGKKDDGSDRLYGIASVADEFKDRGFLIPAHVTNEPENSGWTGESGANNFNISKFKMILVSEEPELYTNEEVDAYNAQLDGAVKAGDSKNPSTAEVTGN